jgi:uncharacterized protein with NRDE domain
MVEPLDAGIHSLSNGLPDEAWPRRERLHLALSEWLEPEGANPDELLHLLSDETPLSECDGSRPIFIRNEHYGTRCSTVVAVDRVGTGVIIERRFSPDGLALDETQINFHWQV